MSRGNAKIEIQTRLVEKARATSESPGVYRMLDKEGKILYVGKAKSLHNRVRSYFTNAIEDPKTQVLVSKVQDFDVILTSSETEALILESILIKKHKPRYNILLKDDKSYPYVVIDENHSFPKLAYTRRPKKNKKQKVFGPYASAQSLRQALRFLNHSFRLRDCSDVEFTNRSRPCINYQIGICSAPCVGYISSENYTRDMEQAQKLLAGKGEEALRGMKNAMEDLAGKEEFEQAARIRDQITQLEETLSRKRPQSAVATTNYEDANRDALGWYRKEASACISMLFVRGGNLVDSTSFHFNSLENKTDEEIIFSFLAQFYLTNDKLSEEEGAIGNAPIPGAEGKSVPKEILLPFALAEGNLLIDGLLSLGHKTEILLPQRGIKHDLLVMAEKNATHAFEEKQREQGSIYRVLSELKAKLRLENYPRRMECFDISNLGDTGIVASRVTFIEGKPDKSLYRHYKIQSIDTQNDFAAMKEVITRRLMKSAPNESGEISEEAPDLLIIDGGKGQLSMAIQAIQELNITGMDVVGLAKAKTESNFETREVEKSFERVFKPGRMNPIALAPDSAICHLMQRIRDEAHRFALEFQRKQRKITLDE